MMSLDATERLAYLVLVMFLTSAVFVVLGCIEIAVPAVQRAGARSARVTLRVLHAIASFIRAQQEVTMWRWEDRRTPDLVARYKALQLKMDQRVSEHAHECRSAVHIRHDPYFIPEWLLEPLPEYLKVQAA